MLFAGVAWSAEGYEVGFSDQAGRPDPRVRARRFGGGELPDLVAFLSRIARESGPLGIVVESTNGAVDGFLLAAGLEVYRADPALLDEALASSNPELNAPRPEFGSVPALALARIAAARLDSLSKLSAEDGSLTGRYLPPAATFAPVGTELERRGREAGCVKHGPRKRAAVALSFDDGPHPEFTNQILEILARYQARATFFPIGLSVSELGDLLAKAADAGHAIGNHTWSHPYLPDLSAAGLREQVDRTSEAVASAVGARPSMVRPPYGSLTAEVLEKWTGLGFEEQLVLWDVDSADWALPGAEAIADKTLKEIQPGSIVLMHDSGGDRSQTVQALPAIIEGCLERGYGLATVPELLGPH